MSHDSIEPLDDHRGPQAAGDPVPSAVGSGETVIENSPFHSIDSGTSEEVIAFRLGRATWRLWTITLPLAVTNYLYYRQQKETLRHFLDAALGRLAPSQERMQIQRQLSDLFNDWQAELSSEPRHDELVSFFEALTYVEIYDREREVSRLISELNLSTCERFRESVRNLVETSLTQDRQRRCYASGMIVEQGVLPEYPVELILDFRAQPGSGHSPNAATRPAQSGHIPPPWLVTVDPILPGQLAPDSDWRGLFENRIQEVGLTIPDALLNGVVDPQPDSAGSGPSGNQRADDQPRFLRNPDGSRRSTGSGLGTIASHQEALRQSRMRSMAELITLLERGLASLASGVADDLPDRNSSSAMLCGASSSPDESHNTPNTRKQRVQWYHKHEPDKGSKFRYRVGETLSMDELIKALGSSSNTIRAWGRSGRIWVTQDRRNRYCLWMQSEQAAEEARARLNASGTTP